MKIQTQDLQTAVSEILDTYRDEVKEKIRDSARECAEDGKKKLQEVRMPSASESGSATPSNRREWKAYSGSWSVTDKSTTTEADFVVHNKKFYRLTHLLEYGHATHNGSRTRAFKHIQPVEEEVSEEFEKKVREAISG